MLRLVLNILATIGGVALCGCGVTFSDVTLNKRTPDDFRYRTVLKNSVEFRMDPASNIGLIIAPDANNEYHIIGKPMLAAGSVPVVAALKDGSVYTSKIDSGASVEGNYLTVAASLSASQAAEIDIVDAIHAYVPPAQIPDDQIFALAATSSSVPRYWLSDLYISTVTTTYAAKESANASGSSPAFGAKGNVYADQGEAVHDWVVAARLINVDQYAKAHNRPANGPIPSDIKIISAAPPSSGSSGNRFALREGQHVDYAVLQPIKLKYPDDN